MAKEPDERQEELFGQREELGDEVPLLYVAMPLSQLAEDRDREHVELLAHAVSSAITTQTERRHDPWKIRVHSPIKLSAPWKEDGRTPAEIYALNTGKVWLEADAVIVIARGGGSLGIGQELAWACDLQLPVLYLHAETEAVSRQLVGAAQENDIEVCVYRSPEQLQDIVDRWLARRRATICDGPRRRVGRRLHLANVQERLGQAWETLSAEQQEHVIGTTRIARGRIERILGEPLVLAAASVQELLELQAALRIESGAIRARALPDLRPQQRAALNSAAKEFGWNFEQTLGLYERARRELARGGVRRLPLASNRDWEEFRRDGI